MQKTKQTEDLRIRRTRKQLQQAFIELTVEKGFTELTIRDITERAMVNRSTFYRHYQDKYDLLEHYINDMYELTEGTSSGTEPSRSVSRETPSAPFGLLKHIQQFADFYRAMLGKKGDPYFAERFRQNTQKRFRSLLVLTDADFGPGVPPIDLRISCIAHAGIGAINWWLEQEQPCSPEQLATWMSQISRTIAAPALKPAQQNHRKNGRS